MNNQEKTYDQLMQEIQDDSKKISSSETSLEEAMKIFEEGMKKIKLAEEKLKEYKGRIEKVLADGSLEKFED
ncbi:exodeoxyribonuclease VII small subunit [Mycoplasma putrefaciens]|uniref:Exodeoxyribonuclease VII small subunit n=1 Tax=Mycoplasma putrefaciens (strain ATCC 15718 / NCTC 10155 / C30 KS-1 / KS-1) TaxID=743965 RepID=A0A7U3ZST2_MYCPK|nr:exodeoxyribonuclease VII small subunit [Mycoplasma putrefaciens]AEM68814.1 exodeoxyribonuclease VII small subunit [Mycoplasma putrefaciens KS1]SYV96113.1 exodeoxyribonuclease VII small subunit [Mycoplasma putrefaciens]